MTFSPPSSLVTIAERIVQASPNGVLVYRCVGEGDMAADGTLELVLINATAERIFGSSPTPVSQVPPDVLRDVLRTGDAHRREMELRLPGCAESIYYDVSAVRMDDCVAVFYVDVTDRKRAQQAEQEQAGRTKFILDNALTAIATLDAVRDDSGWIVDFRYTMVNQKVEQLAGLPASELVGQRLLTLFPGTLASGLFEKWVGVMETGEPLHFFEHFRQGDVDAWYETRAMRLGDGLIESYSDVTELRRTQAQQQQQAELLRTIVENGKVGMTLFEVIRDESGAIVDFEYIFTNSINAANTGRTVAEMTGNRLLRLFPGIVDTPFFSTIVEAANAGEARQVVVPYFADGISGWYDITFVGMGNRVLFTDMDVTEQQEHRRQLERANLDLQRSNNNLQQFAYVASHDLQEPLRKIQSFGDLLLSQYGPVLEAGGADMIGRMQSAARRMSTLITDLLAYSRIGMDHDPYQRLSLTDLLADVCDDLSLIISETQADVQIDALPDVLGDAIQLRQLFQNLLSNALKFRQPDQLPVVRITARFVLATDLPSDLTLVSGNAPRFLEISVADNGIGFDDKYRDRIFQVFQRLHTKSQYTGTGVGLAICRKVAENHGGTIGVTSQLGHGATFRAYLPG